MWCPSVSAKRSAPHTSTLLPNGAWRALVQTLYSWNQCAYEFKDIYRTWEEATALPVRPLQEITPKPASPTASTRANAKANVVLRTCARTACSARRLELAHLRGPQEPLAGGAKQREPKHATMHAAEDRTGRCCREPLQPWNNYCKSRRDPLPAVGPLCLQNSSTCNGIATVPAQTREYQHEIHELAGLNRACH